MTPFIGEGFNLMIQVLRGGVKNETEKCMFPIVLVCNSTGFVLSALIGVPASQTSTGSQPISSYLVSRNQQSLKILPQIL